MLCIYEQAKPELAPGTYQKDSLSWGQAILGIYQQA